MTHSLGSAALPPYTSTVGELARGKKKVGGPGRSRLQPRPKRLCAWKDGDHGPQFHLVPRRHGGEARSHFYYRDRFGLNSVVPSAMYCSGSSAARVQAKIILLQKKAGPDSE